MNSNLALFGGTKLISKDFKRFNTISDEEISAVTEVMRTGVLSSYIGAWCDDFNGGVKVREFESNWADFFNVKHAVSVNSWTSGLIAAVGAIGAQPGEEIIVTPWTMSATAAAILHWNAIPVFADINPNDYNININSIEKCITSRTVAIIVADIFGLSANMDSICKLAKDRGLKVISDTAQSPGALYKGKFAGTIADIGGYSLNYHKHIHTGEGGMLVTNDDAYALRLRMIRNHAEVSLVGSGLRDHSNMLGYNFRLGEIESAIGIEQLKKLPAILESRQKISWKIVDGLSKLPGLIVPQRDADRTHVFYIIPLQIDLNTIKASRDKIVEALKAEGLEILSRYQNIHLLPIFQNKIAYGSHGFPWIQEGYTSKVEYKKGICPIAESLYDSSFFGFPVNAYDLDESEAEMVVSAFKKVWENLAYLK